jgi:hypothetical protein
MKPLLAALFVSGLAAAAPALAQTDPAPQTPDQPAVTASRPVPDTSQASPGIPGDQAVNPAPGAAGPYVGHGQGAFYDVDARISNVEQRASSLQPSDRRRAQAALKSIRAEEATQRQRHGQLRDWDRENLNYRLDQLVQQFPSLGAQATASAQQ